MNFSPVVDVACVQSVSFAVLEAQQHYARISFAYWFVFVALGVGVGYMLAVWQLKKPT